MTFSSQASSTIENAELYARIKAFNQELEEKVRIATSELEKSNRELESKVRELSALYEVSRVMGSTLNPEELAAKMLEQGGRLIQRDIAEIWVFEEETGELKILAAYPERGPVIRRCRLDDDASTAP